MHWDEVSSAPTAVAVSATNEFNSLAYIELYLTIAHVMRRFNFDVESTGTESIRITRDRIVPGTEKGLVRVYAKVTDMVE